MCYQMPAVGHRFPRVNTNPMAMSVIHYLLYLHSHSLYLLVHWLHSTLVLIVYH